MDQVRAFYDRLADSYHLTYADWRHDVRRQGAVLDRRARAVLGDGPFRILDCACGIGTQSIGLALRGHDVTATDVSEASVARARKEAEAEGVALDLGVADMRELASARPGPFDVVIACDNVFPHMPTDEDVTGALTAARAVLRPGGLFMASLADYDDALRTRPRARPPRVFDGPEGPRVVQTLTEWSPDGRTYRFTLLILQRRGEEWSLEQHSTTERALRRSELTGLLAGAGFAQVRWHTPEETGFFQPLATARPA